MKISALLVVELCLLSLLDAVVSAESVRRMNGYLLFWAGFDCRLVIPSFSNLRKSTNLGINITHKIKNADQSTPPATMSTWAVGESVTVYCKATAKMDTHESEAKVRERDSLSLNWLNFRSSVEEDDDGA